MLPLDRRMSIEVEFNQVAIAVARMLVRQMDDTFLWLLHQEDTHSDGPRQRTAEVANRIVVLCRRLVEEIERYERWDQIRREQEEQDVAEEDLPFESNESRLHASQQRGASPVSTLPSSDFTTSTQTERPLNLTHLYLPQITMESCNATRHP